LYRKVPIDLPQTCPQSYKRRRELALKCSCCTWLSLIISVATPQRSLDVSQLMIARSFAGSENSSRFTQRERTKGCLRLRLVCSISYSVTLDLVENYY